MGPGLFPEASWGPASCIDVLLDISEDEGWFLLFGLLILVFDFV